MIKILDNIHATPTNTKRAWFAFGLNRTGQYICTVSSSVSEKHVRDSFYRNYGVSAQDIILVKYGEESAIGKQ